MEASAVIRAIDSAYDLAIDTRWSHGEFIPVEPAEGIKEVRRLPFIGWATVVINLDPMDDPGISGSATIFKVITDIQPIFLLEQNDKVTTCTLEDLKDELSGFRLTRLIPTGDLST